VRGPGRTGRGTVRGVKIRRIGYATLFLLGSLIAACGDTPAARPEPNHPQPVTQASASPSAASVAPATTTAPAASSAAPLSMFDRQLKSLHDYVTAFNRHDAAAIGALYDEDAVFMERGEFTSIGGAITDNYQRHFEAFPDCTTAITRSWHKGDLVVFEYAEGGTDTGPHRSHKPTGKKVGYVGASILQFNAKGLVKKDSTYYDELTMEVQAGWAKAQHAKLEVRPVSPVSPATSTWEVHQVPSIDGDQPKLLALGKSLSSSFQTRSEKDYLAALSDDIVLARYDEPKDAVGKADVARLFNSRLKVFSASAVNAEEGWTVDGYVVIVGTLSGTQVGAWGPLKATNKSFKSHFLDIARVSKTDKVERVWTYANNYEVLRDLGY
jgi:ketosteroid isomerase-like protein